jgi:hypothetical protein
MSQENFVTHEVFNPSPPPAHDDVSGLLGRALP